MSLLESPEDRNPRATEEHETSKLVLNNTISVLNIAKDLAPLEPVKSAISGIAAVLTLLQVCLVHHTLSLYTLNMMNEEILGELGRLTTDCLQMQRYR